MMEADPPPVEPRNIAPDQMSQVLLEFADPALDVSRGHHSWNSAITLAVLAWNVSLLPEAKQQQVLETRLQPLMALYTEVDQTTVRQIIEMLIQRRLREYPGTHGFIVGFELDESTDPPSLSVTSSGGGTVQ